MLIKKPDDIPYSEVTPKKLYLNRRNFLAAAGMTGVALSAGKLIRPALPAQAGSKLEAKKSDLSTHGVAGGSGQRGYNRYHQHSRRVTTSDS